MSFEEKFNALINVIERSSEKARVYFDSPSTARELKTDDTVVTEIDGAIEHDLRSYISEYFPEDTVVGEEEDTVRGESEFVWHIDPIDGTDNFMRKIPFCGISVARLGDGPEDSFGIVHNPITNHTFASVMEDGAYENQRLTDLTAEPLSSKYFVTVGCKPSLYSLQTHLAQEFGTCKSLGCTALQLAYLAAGRIDGNLSFNLNSYDYAAGLYLVRAAGGVISTFVDDSWQIYEGSLKALCAEEPHSIFCSHRDVHEKMTAAIGDPRQWAEN